MKFTNLRVFSCFSLSESIVNLKELMNITKNRGMEFVSICDRMNIYGAVEFSNLAVKNQLKTNYWISHKGRRIWLFTYLCKKFRRIQKPFVIL